MLPMKKSSQCCVQRFSFYRLFIIYIPFDIKISHFGWVELFCNCQTNRDKILGPKYVIRPI